jgi:hypothetical protein
VRFFNGLGAQIANIPDEHANAFEHWVIREDGRPKERRFGNGLNL